MMYKLLCDYATLFGVDFPISAIKDTANEYEAVGIIKECLDTGIPYQLSAVKPEPEPEPVPESEPEPEEKPVKKTRNKKTRNKKTKD